MDPCIFTFDGGWGQGKWRYNGKQGKLPSAVANMPALTKGNFGSPKGLHTVGGKTLIVGKDAIDVFCQQIYSREMPWLLDYLPFFVAQAAVEAGITDLSTIHTLSLGLPIADFALWKSTLIERMSDIEIDGVRHAFKVIVTQQGVGAMIAFRCERNGLKDNSRGLILDVGANTALVVSHKGWQPTFAGSTQYPKSGMSVAAENLRGRLEEINGKKYSLIETLEIMRVREVSGRAATILDINYEIDQVLASFARGLVEQINQDYGEYMGAIDHLVLTGGGAEVVRPYLPMEWPQAIVLDDPEFGNVRGYAYRARDGA